MLLVVVITVMLLSLAAYKYMFAMQTEHLAVVAGGDRLVASQAAQSARDLLAVLLEQSRADRDALGGLADNPSLFAGNPSLLMEMAATSQSQTTPPPFGVIAYPLPVQMAGLNGQGSSYETGSYLGGSSSDSNFGNQGSMSSAAEQGGSPLSGMNSAAGSQFGSQFGSQLGSTLGVQTGLGPPTRYGAINESSKLHLARLLAWDAVDPEAAVAALLQLPSMDRETAEAIMDWLDPNDDARDNGAEAEFYSTLSRPLLPRNGLPSDLDELLFVKGVSAWRLFGIQTDEMPFANLQSPQLGNSNSVANSYSSSSTSTQSGRDGQAETMFEPWANYLTLYSAERNQTYAGEPRIFVNGKDLQKLHGDLKAVMPEKWADFVVLYRQLDESARITNGGEDDDGDRDEAGESGSSENRNSSDRGSSSRSSSNPESDDSEEFELELSKPAVSQISNLMELVDVTLRFEREEDDEEVTVNIKSPFQADTRVVSLAAVFDALTVLPTKRIAGRININEARVEVVATLPGLDLETAEAIVAAREQGQGRG